MAGDVVVIEAETEEVAHRQQEQPRQHQGSGQQQRQYRRALPVTVLATATALVLGRPQDPRPHQQHLMEDQHEHRRYHIVHIAHGGIEHRHHIEGHRIPTHGCLWQCLAMAQQARHLHLCCQGTTGLRQPFGNSAVDQKVGGIAGIAQGDALALHQIPIEVVGNVQDPARLPGHHQLARFGQRMGSRHQLHLRRGIGHKFQLTGQLAAILVDHHHRLFPRQLMQIGLGIEERVEKHTAKQGQHDGAIRQQGPQL